MQNCMEKILKHIQWHRIRLFKNVKYAMFIYDLP